MLVAVKVFVFVLRAIPHRVVLGVARALGLMIGTIRPLRRRILYGNLATAFGSSLTPTQHRRLVRECHAHCFMVLVEMLRIPKMHKRIAQYVVETEGYEHLEAAMRVKGGALIGISAHLGNWELVPTYLCAARGLSVTSMAKPLHNRRMDKYINDLRRSSGADILSTSMGAKGALGILRKGEIVGFIADQDAGRRGEFLTFFGRTASTYVGPAMLARGMKVPLVPTFVIRLKFDKFKLVALPPILPPEGDLAKEEIVNHMMQEFNNRLEDMIRKYPEQYFWFHNRWKSQPDNTKMRKSKKRKARKSKAAMNELT